MIKSFFNPGKYPQNINVSLLMLRLTVGFLMLTHGMGKFSTLFGDAPIQFPDPLGLGMTISLVLTVFSEVFCSVLLILGLGARLAAIPLIITMLVAAFVIHATDGIGKQELPLMYAAIYFVIAIAGAGKLSMDHLIFNKTKR